ncbi:unnamed protein product [Schistocephalus solidus]|uniref:Fimbrial protein n=1 Tax=Schistocephalus solidus TaxID=70667 RepID=A0A183TH60_SCHSO|nr:unnamed protein product [Schistocephalus solidus]
MAFTDSESCARLHVEGNIAGSADLNLLINYSVDSEQPFADIPAGAEYLINNTESRSTSPGTCVNASLP